MIYFMDGNLMQTWQFASLMFFNNLRIHSKKIKHKNIFNKKEVVADRLKRTLN